MLLAVCQQLPVLRGRVATGGPENATEQERAPTLTALELSVPPQHAAFQLSALQALQHLRRIQTGSKYHNGAVFDQVEDAPLKGVAAMLAANDSGRGGLAQLAQQAALGLSHA